MTTFWITAVVVGYLATGYTFSAALSWFDDGLDWALVLFWPALVVVGIVEAIWDGAHRLFR